LARLAILLCEGKPSSEDIRLARILDFLGVPSETVEVSELANMKGDAKDSVVFGLAETVAAAERTQRVNNAAARHAAFYIYTSSDWAASERGLQSLCGNPNLLLRQGPVSNLLLRVSAELTDLAGPMAGLETSLRLRREDAVLTGVTGEEFGFTTVITAGGAPVFVRYQQSGVPVFVCASSYMVDIDQTVGPGFYDVKDHFCSVVPLVMFLKFMFPDVAWRPQELGACLIIDDPLLKQRYGACDFGLLLSLMQRYGFTTNIAFIPWNWRRTSPAASDFFRKESGRFSVSIHGCDHIAAEFGETSPAVLNNKIKLAQIRMRNHEARTGIHHDPVMIFPQGVFSSMCPAVLKRNGFLAAVNTETVPADAHDVETRISDVWDIAITRYGCFPIFTRRYPDHGLENFAFDLLLGKPCLIVSHHEFFKDGCAELIELIEKLSSLNCRLRWRPLGDVIRRACRHRTNDMGVNEVDMYGNELLIHNPLDQVMNVHVRKRENKANFVSEVNCDEGSIAWTTNGDYVFFSEKMLPHSDRMVQVVYRDYDDTAQASRSLSFELSVAARRILSEIRDEYLS
jgi:hypothetical protein